MLATIDITRDERIDSLRGLLIAIMAINHLNYFAPPISGYSFQPFGFVSAAEGFVFLSGLIAGVVYPRYCIRQNTLTFLKKVYRRAGMIYGAHILTFVAIVVTFLCVPYYFEHWQRRLPNFSTHTADMLARSVVLLYQPRFFDILPMYFVFYLALPLAIFAVVRKNTVWVLAGSLLVYMTVHLSDLTLGPHLFEQSRLQLGYFNYLTWQLLFFVGVIVGARASTGESLQFLHGKWLASCSIVIVLVLFAIRHNYITVPNTDFDVVKATSRDKLAWLRLLNFLAFAHLIYLLASARSKFFNWPFFALLGRYALIVFSVQLLLVYMVTPWLRHRTYGDLHLQILCGGLFVVVLYVFARLYHACKMKTMRQLDSKGYQTFSV
jgi:hypothetical protein